ncbi:MAG TPA: HAMP domain-containing sensor histidine kinase [Longimicrobium sp.]|nr:HAMP domain-containing sensor histidine kinase [Longimicrobium sp.]
MALLPAPGRRAETLLRDRDAAVRTSDSLFQVLRARANPSEPYTRAAAAGYARWESFKQIIRREEEILRASPTDTSAAYRQDVVTPAFEQLDRSLDPISAAIDREGEEKVAEAQDVSGNARRTTLTALAIALALTIIVGSLMTRALLRPIQELRRGMAHVAEGDFKPDVRVPRGRQDEIGDLARSFTTMTTQLAELDRLKAEFVSVASHEIKTPLSVIKGYVSLLADGIYGPVGDQQKKTLGSISDQVDRLTRLVHRLLDISRFEAGGGRLEVRRINVRDFLDELTAGFRVLAYQNEVQFAVRVADDVPVNIEGDADRLNEVLGNLLSNAFKFTPSGGTIRVEARRDGGAGVEVEVSDTGVGIPQEKLPKIFEKFYQVENEAQPRSVGSGLGLAIAREIVEAHGGTIGATSQEGKGTTFRVVLPERPPAPAAAVRHT